MEQTTQTNNVNTAAAAGTAGWVEGSADVDNGSHLANGQKSSRFDYIQYDKDATTIQEAAKSACQYVESYINLNIIDQRSKAVALTKLEEVYMWIGKGIRNDQLTRAGGSTVQERRTNS